MTRHAGMPLSLSLVALVALSALTLAGHEPGGKLETACPAPVTFTAGPRPVGPPPAAVVFAPLRRYRVWR